MSVSGIWNNAKYVGAAAALTCLVMSGCSAEDPDTASKAKSSHASSGEIPKVEQNDELRNRLPEKILDADEVVSVNSGSFPPYIVVGSVEGDISGATADLEKALEQLWGIGITENTVDGLSSELTGISAGRYDMAFGPVGDFKERQNKNDFIDYVQEFVVFAVQKGNPKKIEDVASTCGLKIAVQAGGSAEKVIKDQSKECESDGDKAIEVMSFKDQPQSILSVQSGRSDAFFSSRAPLTYFVEESDGKLELAGTESKNGFDTLYQGAVVPKDSEMGPVLEDSLNELFENGTYEAIMKKWKLGANAIDKPGKNLAVN
ncbi:polar amino acid transport system substrate-binding protein [Brevibacterium sp. 239c]|uniref:ABC transporter substrate-binding protein n=1 Tax=Brevibacterium sp. 239c TaxID=1965356 RepID=UPI000C617B66|nr:ABC transporter substrate-binding protein [Brevibacterium sp. 239c]SMX79700.1 polar amino acid transport system substrate-binding protein [Brevibacterium sp. 239c]